MSSPAHQHFTYLLPAYSPVHHTDPTLPTSTKNAQRRFDSELSDLVDHWELQSDKLFFVSRLRGNLVLLTRWSSAQALSGYLKTKSEIQMEKDAEKELEESGEPEADGMTDVSFGDVASEEGGEGVQPFGHMVIGSADAWGEDATITEQEDFWELEDEDGKEVDEDEDEMGVV